MVLGGTETGNTTQVMACAATWLAWVACFMDDVTDIPRGACASDRGMHALLREVQGCIGVA